MTPLRDDDRILRDIEKIPEQKRREGLMAILERELDLAPLSGDPAIVKASRETRYRILEELSIDWEQKYAYRTVASDIGYGLPFYEGKEVAMKPGLWGALKRKDAQFWFQHRDYTPEEMFLSELFELEPIEGDSPLMADARLARYRLLWELLELQLKDKAAANLEAVEMAGQALCQESPQFWYEHMSFSADELIKLHFPDIQNWQTSSVRASKMFTGGIFLTIAIVFFLVFMAYIFHYHFNAFSIDSTTDELIIAMGRPCGICAIVMLGIAFLTLFSIQRSWRGKGLYGKAKKR